MTPTQSAIAALDVPDAFKLVEFYENAANTVKERIWAITTWILSINTALFAYAFNLYVQQTQLSGAIWIQIAICAIGLGLCAFLSVLIRDQGQHLIKYWARSNQIAARHPGLQDLILKPGEADAVLKPGYSPSFPRFCRSLLTLVMLFAAGFVAQCGVISALILLRQS